MLCALAVGSSAGRDGVWAYVRGGMGAVSEAIAAAAREAGAQLLTSSSVDEVLVSDAGRVEGVRLASGTVLKSRVVLGAVNPHELFRKLIPRPGDVLHRPPSKAPALPAAFARHVDAIDYSCGRVSRCFTAHKNCSNHIHSFIAHCLAPILAVRSRSTWR